MERHVQDPSTFAVRRRRRVGRPMREQTPDPHFKATNGVPPQCSDDDSSHLDTATTTSEEAGAMRIRMRIRPPGTMSAHESKILRRRDKTLANAAARSHSQPRQAERLSGGEADDLLRSVKRSLSLPRHQYETSESEMTATGIEQYFTPTKPTTGESLSRLEQNLRRFEEERKRFETEKRQFEREKREHRLRYKQLHDSEERKYLMQTYRKLSDRIQLPGDSEERRRMVHSLRLQRHEVPLVRVRHRSGGGAGAGAGGESSTQFSSSDADTEEARDRRHGHGHHRAGDQLSPVRRHAIEEMTSGHSMAPAAIATKVRRGPPPEPPKASERHKVNRNDSLSPIRPQRRSRTPEHRSEMQRRLSVENVENVTPSHDLRRRQNVEIIETTKQNLVVGSEELEPTEMETKSIATEEKIKPKTFLHKLADLFQRPPGSTKAELKKPFVPVAELPVEIQPEVADKILSKAFLRDLTTDARRQWRQLKVDYPREVAEMRQMRNKCITHAIALTLLCGFGGLLFRYTEGTAENIYKCEVRKVKRDFIDNLWTVSHNMREDDWKSLARQKLRKFEDELNALQEMGIRRVPGSRSWNFVNCIVYCWTVITTIGYGHITPKTTLGQTATIVYAIIGIPMFLIILADFGKLFTRGMKFLWAYVRRLYYTGTCRSIRKQQQVRDAMTGINSVYDLAMRRSSHFFGMTAEGDLESQASEPNRSTSISHPETPTSPYPETFEVDDEFNLPVSVASVLLISYILIGAFVYTLWEDWTYFEAFYFVFISMSTIGFGDLVPNHPIFMMCSIIYLVFGLALTSMFINVVQIKLSDTFKQASAKISSTIGFGMASEMGDIDVHSQMKTPTSELASVHGSRLGKIAENEDELALSLGQQPPRAQPLQSILRRPPSPASLQTRSDEIAGSEMEIPIPPPLMPKKTISMEHPPEKEKKKKRFFK